MSKKLRVRNVETPQARSLRGRGFVAGAVALVMTAFLAALMPIAPAAAAVRVSRAELSGTQLRVEGSNAVASALVSVRSTTSTASARADGAGQWRVTASGFSAPTCTVSVNDGTGAVTATLSGCTPTQPPSSPNQVPTAAAGPDAVVADDDGDGRALVTYDGTTSIDPDGTVVGYSWSIKGSSAPPLGTTARLTVSQPVGQHTVVLTVTDDDGAQDTDEVTITVAKAPTTQTPGARQVLQSDQAWSGSHDSAVLGGSVASAGDVNGDGFDDVVVGALGYDAPGGLFDEGAAFVFLGSANGVVGNSPGTAHAAIVGREAGAELGTSVDGAGDVNGDGFDDIIVGAPVAGPSGLTASGAAYVFLGSPRGIVASSPADAAFVLESKQIEGHMGHAVASAGDVNRDGFGDVIVGAEFYGMPFDPPLPNQGSGRMGASFVFLGSRTGIVGSDPATAHASFLPWRIETGSQDISSAGSAVSGAGDVNGDGYDDVVVGVAGYDDTGLNWPGTAANPYREGAALIFHGGPGGIARPSVPDARIEGAKLQSAMGSDVSGAGDVNRDGYDDVVIGAQFYPAGDPLLLSQEGAAFVFHGSATGITATSARDANRAYIGAQVGEHLGWAVSDVGDTDSDGYADIMIGARKFPGAIPEDGAFNGTRWLGGEGIAYLLRGGSAGITAASLADAPATVRSGQEGGSAGYSVGGGGDVNADGRADTVVGVPGWSGGHSREGAAFVSLSGSGGDQPPPPPPPPPPAPNAPPVAAAGPDQVVVDANGDGSEVVTYNGSASADPDGSLTGWRWDVVGATRTQLGNQAAFSVRQSVGTYTVELTVTDDDGATASDTVVVAVKPAATSPLVAPALVSPAGGARFNRGQRVTFDWSDVSGAASYTIQVDDVNTFTAPLTATAQPNASTWSTTTLPARRLFWRVRARDAAGNPGAWSVVRSVEIR